MSVRTFFSPLKWVLLLALALSLVQQFSIRDEVFVSGDGGIKTLVTRQIAHGDWHADLRLPAEPWVDELWRDGFYPFGPPFAYQRQGRWFIQYPLPFMIVTAPFYARFGFRGLTIVPLLGLWLLWFSMVRILRHARVSELGSAVSLAGLSFCSFVTPYGAMYWEHTLALGLSFSGLAVALGERAESDRVASNFAAGLLLGLAIWFRPESLAFAVAVCAGLIVMRRRTTSWLSACAGVGLASAVFAGINLSVYGSLLGVHAVQEVDPLTAYVAHRSAYAIGVYFIEQLFRYCPVIGLVVAFGLGGVRWPAIGMGRRGAMLWVVVVLSSAGTALLVPNAGGTQLGARYFLHSLPPLFVLLGLVWDRAVALNPARRRALQGLILLGLALGVHLNAVRGTQAIFADYRYRALPALQALRKDPNRIVVVEHQWMAQDLEAVFADKTFFRVRNEAEFEQLSRALFLRDRRHFTLVRYADVQTSVLEAPGLRVHLHSLGRFGTYFLVRCELEASDAVGPDHS